MSKLSRKLRIQPEDDGSPSRMEMLRQRTEAADEIERLESALRKIADWKGGCGADWPQEIARKALGTSESEGEDWGEPPSSWRMA